MTLPNAKIFYFLICSVQLNTTNVNTIFLLVRSVRELGHRWSGAGTGSLKEV